MWTFSTTSTLWRSTIRKPGDRNVNLKILADWPGRFRDALAFLTRLVPPRASCTAASLTAALPFFVPVGLALGALSTLAALAAQWCLGEPGSGLAGGLLTAALGGWAWLLCDIWSTRGLHWDGLADLGDAVGCGATGERFWQVLRDSRLGAFGALHMLAAFSGQWLALTWHFSAGHWIAPVLAPAWGRAACVWLAAYTAPREAHSLGGLACAGATPKLARWHVLLAAAMLALVLLPGDCPFWRLPVLAFGQFLLVHGFMDTARDQGGVSGDFLGACIVWSQLWFLLVTV